jgi:general secretion pathway protein G
MITRCARAQKRQEGMTNTKRRGGFTFVEIMIIILIIGYLASIAIPNFVEGRKKAVTNACKSNQRQLAGAVISYGADNETYPGSLGQLTPAYMKRLPNCPANRDSEYYYNSTAGDVGCSHDSSHNLFELS